MYFYNDYTDKINHNFDPAWNGKTFDVIYEMPKGSMKIDDSTLAAAMIALNS